MNDDMSDYCRLIEVCEVIVTEIWGNDRADALNERGLIHLPPAHDSFMRRNFPLYRPDTTIRVHFGWKRERWWDRDVENNVIVERP